ncbi:hypothetical protein K474DRAFT_1710553, partial [Panus rudis PR-1116 ss-1]
FNPKRFVEKLGSDKARAVRGQIWHYFASQCSRQHRPFIIGWALFGDHIRFYRVDRSGMVVSEEVYFKRNPELFAEFLWRYSHMSREERGFDTSVTPASEDEKQTLTRAVREYEQLVKIGGTRRSPDISLTLDDTYPTYRARVDDESTGKSTFYIIRRPIAPFLSLFGRATRGYIALDFNKALTTGSTLVESLVFLKDTWRLTNGEKEGDVYRELLALSTPNIPEPLCSGDVLDLALLERDGSEVMGFCQMTKTQHWANKRPKPYWKPVSHQARALTHYRIVLPLACPLNTVANAKELVTVLRDVIVVHVHTHHKHRIHRDVTPGNILISRTVKTIHGLLSDWDHSRTMEDRIPAIYRTGNWQFLSTSLYSNSSRDASIHDDLESVYWVLLFVALHHFQHEGPLPSFFANPSIRGIALAKWSFLDNWDGRCTVTFACPALQQLHAKLTQLWWEHNNPRSSEISAEDLKKKLLCFFESTLGQGPEQWVNGEWQEDQYPKMRPGDLTHAAEESSEYSVSSAAEGKVVAPTSSVGNNGGISLNSTKLARKRQAASIKGTATKKAKTGNNEEETRGDGMQAKKRTKNKG